MNQQDGMTQQEMRTLKKNIAIRFSLIPLSIALFILLPAWTWKYWQAYLYIAILVIPMIIVISYFLKKDPMFLVRRTRTKEKEKQQKLIVLLSSIIFISSFVIPGLDKRFNWSHIPTVLVLVADAIILLGYLMIFFVFKQNSYASRIVEVDENQEVISTGLYGFIRHPMYLGVLIMFLPMPIALGSYWGLIPIAILPIILIQRILTEEETLTAKLEGYKEYCQKNKYRLLPFVW